MPRQVGSGLPVRDVIGWDVRNWSRALPFWQRRIDRQRPERALVIGDRAGGLSLWLADQGIDVLCSDLEIPTESVRTLHRRSGVGARVTYASIDATAIDRPDASFDLIVFKSVIGALSTKERQHLALSEMARVLAPGGLLLFAENLVGSRLHASLRSRFVPWDAGWRYLDLSSDLDLFAAFDQVALETWGVIGLLGRNETQRDVLARLDSLVSPIVPESWRYIVFGAGRRSAGRPRRAG